MNESMIDMQKAIDYIESNLTEELNISDIAAEVYLSPFHFQRIFHAICGVTVGKYIRQRRLTLAGKELMSIDKKVIDFAIKYGYDSPDSFSRAFTRFHGRSPSYVRGEGVGLKIYAPIKIEEKEGSIMEHKIVKKESFTIVGIGKRFNGETSYIEVPKFWDEYFQNEALHSVSGMFGACVDCDGAEFDYYIADLYEPWKEIPDGFKTVTFEGGEWAVFPWKGECPDDLQTVNTYVWSQWLPNCKEYDMRGNYNLEVYLSMEHGEIWVPVKKK